MEELPEGLDLKISIFISVPTCIFGQSVEECEGKKQIQRWSRDDGEARSCFTALDFFWLEYG